MKLLITKKRAKEILAREIEETDWSASTLNEMLADFGRIERVKHSERK